MPDGFQRDCDWRISVHRQSDFLRLSGSTELYSTSVSSNTRTRREWETSREGPSLKNAGTVWERPDWGHLPGDRTCVLCVFPVHLHCEPEVCKPSLIRHQIYTHTLMKHKNWSWWTISWSLNGYVCSILCFDCVTFSRITQTPRTSSPLTWGQDRGLSVWFTSGLLTIATYTQHEHVTPLLWKTNRSVGELNPRCTILVKSLFENAHARVSQLYWVRETEEIIEYVF